MAAETLEDLKPNSQASNKDATAAEPKSEENYSNQEKEGEAEEEQHKDKEKKVDSDDQEESNEEDAEHESEDEEEIESGGKTKRKGSAKAEQNGSNNSGKERVPATPASERPSRERKTVERYMVSSPSKFPGFSSTKSMSIEQGHGTQLKDIPNVAFKLSKRKPDDNLRTLHSILFGKKAKANILKRNIGLFSGYVWTENEDKQRARIKERIDKCVKEKLVDFCDVLNIPIKSTLKKEEVSAKLLEFLESPHATTDVLLADKEKKGKKRARKRTPSKSSRKASGTPAKKQKQASQVGKKRKQSSDVEEEDTIETSDSKDESKEDSEDVSVPESESDREESQSEEEDDKPKAHEKYTSKKTVKEDPTTPGLKTSGVKASKSNEKTPKKTVKDSTSGTLSKSKQSGIKKQKTVTENQNTKEKISNKKQIDKSSEDSVKDQDEGIVDEKTKAEPSREDIHAAVVDILKQVDFNTATLSDILRRLGTHFDVDLMPRKKELKNIITDVISSMPDAEDGGEEDENEEDDDADKNDA